MAVSAAAAGRGLTGPKDKGHRLRSMCWLRALDTHLCAVRQQHTMEMDFAFLQEQLPSDHVSSSASELNVSGVNKICFSNRRRRKASRGPRTKNIHLVTLHNKRHRVAL